MIERLVKSQVEQALRDEAAVALIGPRQVGKTTLALEVGRKFDAVYLDLESAEDRERLTDKEAFFQQFADRLVILDEIHRVPELFQTLRGVIDRGRREGRGEGRFLLLGSASIDLLRQSESLAGRIAYVDMSPILISEIDPLLEAREQLWLRGGFPRSFLANSDRQSFDRRQNLVRTYLERDIPEFGPRIPAETILRLWTMLAHRQGSLLNGADLAKSLEVHTATVHRYIDLLVDLLLVRRLQPYHVNVGKRLVKSPKTYLRDSGLLHALLGITDYFQLSGHPVYGLSWEGFVIENLISSLPWRAVPFFYRTSAGAEVDLLIEFVDMSKWVIEIKRSMVGNVSRGFYSAREDLQPTRSFVVHASDDRFPLADGIEAIGVRELMEALQNAG